MELTEQNAKRAANMVWTAAGDYDLKPLYLFYQDNGEPDIYRNTLEGLGYACLAKETVEPFLRGVGSGHDPEKYLPITLLALEQVIYSRWTEKRPSLDALREEYAAARLEELQSPRRYQPLSQERQVILRCRYILWKAIEETGQSEAGQGNRAGQKQQPAALERWETVVRQFPEGKTFAKKEIQLSWELLRIAENSGSDAGLVSGIKDLLWRYYMYRFLPARQEEKAHFLGAGFLLMLAGVSLSEEIGGYQEERASGAGKEQTIRTILTHLKSETTPEEDRNFVEHTFGPSILTPSVVRRMWEKLCRGLHRECFLWYAGAETGSSEYTKELEKQAAKNRAYYEKDRRFYDRSIDKMVDRLKHAIEAQLEPDVVYSDAGRLDASRVYRVRVQRDLSIFHREISHPTPDFTVDLLLDASSSRIEEQESIAAQAYMITQTLMRLEIPVQVCCFRSMRRYTILQRLKEYRDVDSAEGIFHFYSAGSNRDGLAFRAMAPLMEQGREQTGQQVRRRILLILTDAVPADTTKAFVENGIPRRQDYMNELAVEDTRNAIRKMWQEGTYVAAIFWGLKSSVPDLKRMYGDTFIRIHEIGELPDAVIGLLLKAIASLRDNG